MNLNLEPIITPKSSTSFVFSPFSCGIQMKQEIENLFDIKGQEFNSAQLLSIDHRGIEFSNIIDFPSPISIQNQISSNNFMNNIPILELPMKIQKN